ncbi:hypothetical protein CK203_056908 [Vitis vinifera]|uniref:Retrotransposon gag domain-containing protein n=1 Tax=Vitis vinifera TaxID=29760 RepID=A0A438FUM0_VITVI|nr:hypothetical protein CK203_056908 [Vitis vinifera]
MLLSGCDVHECRVLLLEEVQIGSAPHVLLGNPDGVDLDSHAHSVSSGRGVPTHCTRRRSPLRHSSFHPGRNSIHRHFTSGIPSVDISHLAPDIRVGFSRIATLANLEWEMLGESQGAPAGHESIETPIGNKSNGAIAGEGANFIVILFQDCGGRLVKRETPHNKELEVILNIMETTHEDQHSHHDHQDNPNEFISMRDCMHPPRMSALSCIVPPTEQLVIRPHIVPLLPTFHGMESENPYAHIKEFEDARSIRTWTDLQAEFLKKFFPTHRTNSLKRQISNFSVKENEKFYEHWERYIKAINAYPHHGFDTWLLLKSQGDGMNHTEETMTRRVEELELKKMHEVQAVAKTPVQ